jgi:hypothetical protein
MNSVVSRVYGRELMLEFCERNPLTRLKLDVAPSRELIYGVEEDRWELGFGPFQHHMPGHFVLRRSSPRHGCWWCTRHIRDSRS